MKKPNIHTTYNADTKRWQNVAEKNPAPISTHRTKELADARGAKIAKEEKVEHIVHLKKGPIEKRDSYGNDPFPPRG